MMTLGRFQSLLDAYGAEPQRWPQELREDAQALLHVSTEARALAEEARALDAAIAAAAWPSAPDEALSRLRRRVAARIAALPRPAAARPAWRFGSRIDALPWPRLYWVGLATGGTFLVMAGLGLGATYATSPDSHALLTMLQPAPIEILVD